MNELTLSEAQLRDQLENEIEQHLSAGRMAYMEAGRCLAIMLDQKLYRSEYATFDDYCRDFWEFDSIKARRMADAYRVAANLQTAAKDMPLLFWDAVETMSESHARVLKRLPPEQQVEAWSVAKSIADTPTAKLLEEVTAKFTEADLGSMTQAEELEHFKAVESQTMDSYHRGKFEEWKTASVRAIKKVLKGYRDEFGQFTEDAPLIVDLSALMSKLMRLNGDETKGGGNIEP